jgi:hypothetical protein
MWTGRRAVLRALSRLILGRLNLITPTGTISRHAYLFLFPLLLIVRLSCLYSTSFTPCSFFTSFFAYRNLRTAGRLAFVGWLGMAPGVYGGWQRHGSVDVCSAFIWTWKE